MLYKRPIVHWWVKCRTTRRVGHVWISLDEFSGKEKGQANMNPFAMNATQVKDALRDLAGPIVPTPRVWRVSGITLRIASQKVDVVVLHKNSGTIDIVVCERRTSRAGNVQDSVHSLHRNH